MMLFQKRLQRTAFEAVDAEADNRILFMVEDRDQFQRSERLPTLLRLPAAPLHLVKGPNQLLQAEFAAEEIDRDDDEHDAGTAQRNFHLARRVIAVSAGGEICALALFPAERHDMNINTTGSAAHMRVPNGIEAGGRCCSAPQVSLVNKCAEAADADVAAHPQRKVLLRAGVADENVVSPADAALHSGCLPLLHVF